MPNKTSETSFLPVSKMYNRGFIRHEPYPMVCETHKTDKGPYRLRTDGSRACNVRFVLLNSYEIGVKKSHIYTVEKYLLILTDTIVYRVLSMLVISHITEN